MKLVKFELFETTAYTVRDSLLSVCMVLENAIKLGQADESMHYKLKCYKTALAEYELELNKSVTSN